jgi:cadmium resistance protein CadD (predicted permease)
MLTIIAFRFTANITLPKIDYLTRLDDYILSCTALVFFALIEVIISSRMAKHGKLHLARTIDRWSRWVFIVFFVIVLLDLFSHVFIS